MTLLFGLYEYIMNGLPDVTLGKVIFYGGLLVGFSGGIEKVTGKKYIFAWIWSGLKRFFSAPSRFNKAQEKLIADVAVIKKEVMYNGSTSMKDALLRMENNQGEMKEGLKELQFGQQNTLDILDVASWRTDRNGHVTFVSGALCEMIGCIPSDMKHQGWVSRLIPAHRKRIIDEWALSLETKSKFETVATYIRNDGLWIDIRVEGNHYIDERGQIVSSAGRFYSLRDPYKPADYE